MIRTFMIFINLFLSMQLFINATTQMITPQDKVRITYSNEFLKSIGNKIKDTPQTPNVIEILNELKIYKLYTIYNNNNKHTSYSLKEAISIMAQPKSALDLAPFLEYSKEDWNDLFQRSYNFAKIVWFYSNPLSLVWKDIKSLDELGVPNLSEKLSFLNSYLNIKEYIFK